MLSRSSQIVGLFDRYVPRAFQEGALRGIFQAYSTAHGMACLLRREQRQYALPQLRNMESEKEFVAAADRHSRHLTSMFVPNEAHNYSYAQVVAPGRIVITESGVPKPAGLPRDAVFRSTLIRSNELTLFDTAPTPIREGSIYAVITHGVAEPLAKFPAFAFVRFPLPSGEAHEAEINLFSRFPQVVQSWLSRSQETIPEPTLKPRRRTSDPDNPGPA